jgi:hypothetical protein
MAPGTDVGNDISVDDLQINRQFRNLCPALTAQLPESLKPETTAAVEVADD